ncbi:MAG: HEAT repeat domain-containing protein [Candidatus Omnitrophota bacterium]|nr:HEAT repeat domain-containing protein [Candidatus Omnitrophota bacterium]
MPYDPQVPAQEQDKKSIFGVIVHSFFVVPFLIAVFSVLLFAAVRILTMEKHSVYDYLRDIKEGGSTKRWQAAFELSRVLVNKSEVPVDRKFFDGMTSVFAASKHDDDRVRQYLALAMARTGDSRFVPVLLENIKEEKDENLYAIITALGILKSKTATGDLLTYLQDDDPRIRLATVIALGNIADAGSLPALRPMLNDPQPNITWDAAIALAKMGDISAKPMVLKLLDRDYLAGFPQVDAQEQTRIVSVAIEATAGWDDPDIDAVLKGLFASDKNMNVRALAGKVLERKGRS